MCIPQALGALGGAGMGGLFAAELGIGLLQSMLSYQAAKAQAEASAAAAAATAKSAADSARLQYYQENLRLQQEAEATSKEAQQIAIDRKKALGTAMASSDSAGLSLQHLLADYYNQEGRLRAANEKQLGWAYTQSLYNKREIESQARNRINAARASIQPAPSVFALGVNMAGHTLATYQKYYPKG